MATNQGVGRPQPAEQCSGILRDVRLSTVNRVARLQIAGETGLARVHTLHNGGVELSSILDLQIGQVTRIDFSETVSANATVVARFGNRCALKFERPVNCAELLRQLVAEARTSRARPLRLATSVAARGQSEAGVHRLELDDISQRGMKVRHDGSFRPGLRVSIQLPNGRECEGVVRWSTTSSAGLQLVDILTADELGAVSRLSNAFGHPPSSAEPTRICKCRLEGGGK